MMCCGEQMQELIPNSGEASVEKHKPKVSIDNDIVTVDIGSQHHPMEEKHRIDFIYLETNCGGQRKSLDGDEPVAKFALINDKPVAAYALCNLHGLWKTDF